MHVQNSSRGVTCLALLGGYLMGQDDFTDGLLAQGERHCPAWQRQQQQQQQQLASGASSASWQVEVHRYSQQLTVSLPGEGLGVFRAKV